MIFHTLLNPAVWLMRRMRFAGKLILLAALSALPLLAVAWQFLVGSAPGAGLAGVLWVSSARADRSTRKPRPCSTPTAPPVMPPACWKCG